MVGALLEVRERGGVERNYLDVSTAIWMYIYILSILSYLSYLSYPNYLSILSYPIYLGPNALRRYLQSTS